MRPIPPADEKELLHHADTLAGYTLGELSAQAGLPIPVNLKRDKGWVGVLLERYLGANAGSKSEQDFAAIGVELKTIPVDRSGRPLETTFVCVAPLNGNSGVTWEISYVRYKLARVLWIPVEGLRTIPLVRRRIGVPLLWSPNTEEELQLRRDWEELMDLIVLGKVERITVRHGEVLQLRPKAANGQAMTAAIGEFGQPILTLPRGFYLKKLHRPADGAPFPVMTTSSLASRPIIPRITIVYASFKLIYVMFNWTADSDACLALGILTILEIVLRIDNIVSCLWSSPSFPFTAKQCQLLGSV